MLSFVNRNILGPILPPLLIGAGLFFALRLVPILLRHPLRAFRRMRDDRDDTSVRSMITALAGTLGVGNITGVACAITAGGPGAVFWMWVSAFAVMSVKYAEIVLACRYRKRDPAGGYFGSAAQYMLDGLKSPALSRVFAVLLLLSALTVGNMTQTGAAAETAEAFFGIPRLLSGILLAGLLLAVIRGGAKRIVSFTNYLIPPLTVAYAVLSLWIIGTQIASLPDLLSRIVSAAWTPRAGVSGIMGYVLMDSLRLGTSRGIFSNEAGCGTAPTAHASSSSPPAKQGVFGILEVFVDTIVLCTLTAFVILLSEHRLTAYDGTELAIRAFSIALGDWVIVLLALSVMLYALASTVAWAYYGLSALRFLKIERAADAYRLLYCGCCAVGALCPMGFIFELSDFFIGVMTLLNVCALLRLHGQVREETVDYFAKKRRF